MHHWNHDTRNENLISTKKKKGNDRKKGQGRHDVEFN